MIAVVLRVAIARVAMAIGTGTVSGPPRPQGGITMKTGGAVTVRLPAVDHPWMTILPPVAATTTRTAPRETTRLTHT